MLNFTPVPHEDYRIGAPTPGRWVRRLCSDDEAYGGSGWTVPERYDTDATPLHGRAQSLCVRVPPLGILVLAPEAPA